MRIGFDFDNTIVSYDTLFHKIALEQGVIEATIPINKLAVRDYLRATEREHFWTEMQGYVYGARMREADAFPGVIAAMQALKNQGHTLAIMSHKTKVPFLGKQYDLHQAAREWIKAHLVAEGQPLIADEAIFFELTKEEKIARIAKFNCDVFIDDLPEILLAENFPKAIKRYLFDPERQHRDVPVELTVLPSWQMFQGMLS